MNAPTPAASPDIQQLDALTGGVFSAATSGERAQRVRQWLAGQPETEQIQTVYKALNAKDKGAAKPLREHLDELRRSKERETVAADWARRAEALLAAGRLNIADALAWQRDAARAGAPLSREPLAQLKARLAERVKGIEDLQNRVQVQREAAVLLAQRIETLSTKTWREADTASDALAHDVAAWQAQADALLADPHWPSVDVRLPPQLDTSRGQLALVWEAFAAALAQARLAAADAAAALPQVPVWADELRQARGLPAEVAAPAKPPVDPLERERAQAAVQEALTRLEQEIGEGHGKASSGAAAALRQALKEHGRRIDAALDGRAHAALAAAGELEGWQRWRADQLREELVAKAEALLARPPGQALGGRKMQETLRELRAQWKQTDQGGAPNHTLWKRFDAACNQAHKVVEAWLDKLRAEAAEHKAARLALIAELQAWAEAQAGRAEPDWKQVSRELHQFAERWREAGHLSEKAFAELQPQWKAAYAAAGTALATAQKDSLARRQALIEEAEVLGAAPQLRIDAIKALQQRWQAEAHAVPLDRRQEQKLWEAFRQPIDAAFQRKTVEREQATASLGAHDRAVLDAAQALEEASAAQDAQRIQAAMAALETAVRTPPASAEVPAAASGPEAVTPAAQPARALRAMRGDDRPGGRPATTAPVPSRLPARPDGRRREAGAGAGPRLGDAAFRRQREAIEQAQKVLRKLASQAHGEAVGAVLEAWERRDAALLPGVQALGRLVSPAVRAGWEQALTGAPAVAAQEAVETAMLRLELAAELPSPAEALPARRALQLQLLTQRHAPAPAQTWGEDVAALLGSSYDAGRGRRLQQVLKTLLKA